MSGPDSRALPCTQDANGSQYWVEFTEWHWALKSQHPRKHQAHLS